MLFKALVQAFELLVCYADEPTRPPPATGLPLLTSLALEWRGKLGAPLAPLARLTRLTALEFWDYASDADRSDDWLPPNLEELRLGANVEPLKFWETPSRPRMMPRGIGGAGWLAALHAGACPRLRKLHLHKLAVRDVRPAGQNKGRWRGLTLANTLPRLTALEELDVEAYQRFDMAADDDIEFEAPDEYNTDDEDSEGSDGEIYTMADPIPAAPLLAALPNLRHCCAMFVRSSLYTATDGREMLRLPPRLQHADADCDAGRAGHLAGAAAGEPRGGPRHLIRRRWHRVARRGC
jgi:hypothetical protein